MTTNLANFAKLELPLAPRRRARPPKRKTRITIYLDDAVLEQFRALSRQSGMGYQTLINAALRQQVPPAASPLAD